MEQENQVFLEETGSEDSPFYGTPWKSDEEIYEYASHRRYTLRWEWNDVKNDLISQGLDEGYADAIIQNLIESYGYDGTTPSSLELPVIDNRGMFLRPFSFEGRIRRTEFALSMLIYFVVIYAGSFAIGMLVGLTGNDDLLMLIFALWIPCIWFLCAQGAKRCHDLGNSGWYQLIPFYYLWLLFAPGDPETTGYGNSPKS